jgi:DNA-binding response OmpR family regulator
MIRSNRHRALLVDDDIDMAAELRDLLKSFGHDSVHAVSREDAIPLIEAGEFCYVLLDLELKAERESIKAHVEAGESVLELIRETYPHRAELAVHRLPVLMVSGHSDLRHVVKAFQNRADDFIAKPVGQNDPPLKEKIQTALRRSGREKHESCAAVMQLARAGLSPAVAPSEAGTRFEVTGNQMEKRYELSVGGAQFYVTHASLVTLLRLVVGRLEGPQGWVHKNELGARADQGWKGMSRLKKDLSQSRLPIEIEKDGSGSYRLHPSVRVDGVDPALLIRMEDASVTKLAEQIRALRDTSKR